MRRTPIPQPGGRPPHWVEARTSLQFGGLVIAYLVVCETAEEGRVVLRQFRIRDKDWETALRQAEGLRDALNHQAKQQKRA